jgi:hypothetical protein
MKYMILLVLLSGCAHTKVEAWGHDRMTVCGNSDASMEDRTYTAEVSGCRYASMLSDQGNGCVVFECR